MRLAEYLEKYGETEQGFSSRSGVPRSTVNLIKNGGGAGAKNAALIIEATGGLVTIQDLKRDESKLKAAS